MLNARHPAIRFMLWVKMSRWIPFPASTLSSSIGDDVVDLIARVDLITTRRAGGAQAYRSGYR